MTLTLEDKIAMRALAAPKRPRGPDPALEAILAKPDDRLLRDAGLTRADAMGEERYLWWLWAGSRMPWSL